MIVDLLVEGPTDEAVARKIVRICGHEPGLVYGKNGVNYIKEKLSGFNIRVQYGNPILVLVDFMDTRLACPPQLVREWLPDRCSRLLLRAVVNEIESWLLADRQAVAEFLHVPLTQIPPNPEKILDPKRTLVNLARRSRRKRIREEMVPPPGSGGVVGPGYTAMIEEMVHSYWDVERAIQLSTSLERCILRLQELTP